MLNSLSKVIERELAEVQKKTEMLASLKGQLDLINNADKDHRTQLEEKRAQLEADRQNFTEQLRIVENELATVKHLIKNAEDDKRHKIEDLYRNFQTNGVLAITNS
jgi:chromosome segregation ATPase